MDAIGVCENDKTDSRPLERKRSVPFDKLVTSVALGSRDEDTLTTLAGRLARLEGEIGEKDGKEIKEAAGGRTLRQIVNRLLDAVDPDRQIEKAKALFGKDAPADDEIKKASEMLADEACAPFDSPKLRNTIIEIKQRNEQVIDTVSKDEVVFSGFDEQAKEKARTIVESFKKFIEENKNEITALQIIYSQPYGKRRLTFDEIKKLADAIERHNLTPERLWAAYERLERSKVRGTPQKVLTNIISLVRFAIEESDILEPFPDIEERRFREWVASQERAGRRFTPEQMRWLEMIKEHIATSLAIGKEDFENTPFHEKGGLVRFYNVFGQEAEKILQGIE